MAYVPILTVRDDKGKEIPIPAIQGKTGDAGKSAYQAAKDGGFVGSEEYFNSLLGNLGDIDTALDNIIALQENYIAQSPAPISEGVEE